MSTPEQPNTPPAAGGPGLPPQPAANETPAASLQGQPPEGQPHPSQGQAPENQPYPPYGAAPQGMPPQYNVPPQGMPPQYNMPPQGMPPQYGAPGQGMPPQYGMPPQHGMPPQPKTSVTDFTDGSWHRMHPLTPLLRGGLALIIVVGILLANFRERLIGLVIPDLGYSGYGDPFDWALENNLLLFVILGALGFTLVCILLFYFSWRVHSFRITQSAVEVKHGVVFRSQRRSPLDRIQGVNLTRPFLARLIGLSKLEVVGAGSDANVSLEYLSTRNAERIREDILRLASGARSAKTQPQKSSSTSDSGVPGVHQAQQSFAGRTADTITHGVSEIFTGAEAPILEPQNIVTVNPGRVIASQLLSPATLFLVIYVAIVLVVTTIVSYFGPDDAAPASGIFFGIGALAVLIPAGIAYVAYIIKQILTLSRYSIALTNDGLRVTFGLTTTVTETLPPGRVFGLEVSQPLLWRPFGWWRIRINRMTGKSMAQANQVDQLTTLLPVGSRDEVERVLRLIIPADVAAAVFPYGFDPDGRASIAHTPARAAWLHPFSWRVNGFLFSSGALMLRHGAFTRALSMFPFARIQSVSMQQGPLARAQHVATLRVDSIAGPITTRVTAIDRDAVLRVFEATAQATEGAARTDRTHRWAGQE